MKRLFTSVLTIALAANALAKDLTNVDDNRVALSGYDAVGFFADNKAEKGDPKHVATYHGAIYQFSTAEHRKSFKANPEKYLPQTGGYCTYGASVNGLFPVDINTWQVRNGKLYLNKNQDILKTFNADFDGNVAKAEKNWPGLVEKNGK